MNDLVIWLSEVKAVSDRATKEFFEVERMFGVSKINFAQILAIEVVIKLRFIVKIGTFSGLGSITGLFCYVV